jgi:hypothetical protein
MISKCRVCGREISGIWNLTYKNNIAIREGTCEERAYDNCETTHEEIFKHDQSGVFISFVVVLKSAVILPRLAPPKPLSLPPADE